MSKPEGCSTWPDHQVEHWRRAKLGEGLLLCPTAGRTEQRVPDKVAAATGGKKEHKEKC